MKKNIKLMLIGIFTVISIGFGSYSLSMLALKNNYQDLPSERQVAPIINGSFIQYTGLSDWTSEMWQIEFQNLNNSGISTIILQWIHDSESNQTLYQSSYFEFENGAVSPNMTLNPQIRTMLTEKNIDFPNEGVEPDVLAVFFALAEIYGMDLHLGLSIDSQFSEKLDDNEWVFQVLETNEILVSEMLNKYGSLKSFCGFYLPDEMFQGYIFLPRTGTNYGTFFGKIVETIRTIEALNPIYPQKIISIAPYVALPIDLHIARIFWTNFLKNANVDVLMIQDGVGCNRLDTQTEIPIVFKLISEVCQENDVLFWADLEVFLIDDFSPAPFEQVQLQLEIESYYAQKIIIFDIPHYFSSQYSFQAANLWNNYTIYLESL